MIRRSASLVVLIAAVSAGPIRFAYARPATGSAISAKAAKASFAKDIQPLLQEYCYGCHGEKKKGDLDLRVFTDEASVLHNRKVWEAVLKNLSAHEMPPSKKPQPTLDQRELITGWVEYQLNKAYANGKADPGRVTIRRLNRAEYNNTIRDLIGVKFQPADDFPADDVGYGFDNIGDVLSLPPILLEKYLTAAEKVLTAAIVTEDPAVLRTNQVAAEALEFNGPGELKGGGWFRMNREGEIFAKFRFPMEGEYVFRVRAYGEQAGSEPVKMAMRVNGKEIEIKEVPVEENDPQVYEVKTRVAAGTRKCCVAYLNNFVDPKNPDPKRRDRNLVVEYLEVTGPLDAKTPPLPESHRRIFSRLPGPTTTNAVARALIGDFTRRAYRRPVEPVEVDRLMKLFEQAQHDGESFEQSIKLALEAVLVSPHFLFRGELQPEPGNPDAIHPVNEFALASRLSYFLWSSLPDVELFTLAGQGRLRKNLDAQVKRMLKDSKASALVDNFAGQWLQLRNLKSMTPDSEIFPEFDDELRAAMQRETELFFRHIMQTDRSVLEFLNADYSFANERLAQHYGIDGVKGDEFQRVNFKRKERGGLLTQASILTITSNPTRTSPVKRGKWVLENILGTPPPPPPPDVPELKDNKGGPLTGTLRERMEQHRENPLCASCHERMDPIGFGFENFNAVGGWRALDGTAPIDPAGKLVSGQSFQGPTELKEILLRDKRNEFVRCLTEKMLTYALGRGLEFYDRLAVDEITNGLKKNNYHFSALVLEVVKSKPFQMRRGEAEKLADNSP
ncbi:MAG: DUF1592 domain-containing protein [Verrucomicrobia bacterium]|nr:DUF1592 domain-containing protein [Verrucomicrobiota bacterium]